MPLIEKVKLQWNEPVSFVEARDQKAKNAAQWWHAPAGMALVVALFMLNWYAATLNPEKHPVSLGTALFLSTLAGLFVCYGIPWINRRCPSQIKMRAKMMSITRGQNVVYVPYKTITGYAWSADRDCMILSLRRRKGVPVVIAVPDEQTVQSAATILREFDITILPVNGTT